MKTKTKPQTTFSDWLESLPHSEYSKTLKLIEEKTHVSRISVFNWRKGNHKVPPLAQQAINKIAGVSLLFPVITTDSKDKITASLA